MLAILKGEVGGGGAQQVSDLQFPHFFRPPLPINYDQSLRIWGLRGSNLPGGRLGSNYADLAVRFSRLTGWGQGESYLLLPGRTQSQYFYFMYTMHGPLPLKYAVLPSQYI